MSDHFNRQVGILDTREYGGTIHIIGVGGIGSPLAFQLVKMGFNKFVFYDHDILEEHNIANQMYRLRDVGKPKVEALEEFLRPHTYEGQYILPHKGKFTDEMTIDEGDIVMVCVDSMDTRIDLWRNMLKDRPWGLYMEARMGGEIFKIYSVTQDNKNDYDTPDILYPSSEAVELPCTARAILYNTFALSGFMGACLSKHLRGQDVPFELIGDMVNLQIII